jgi:hypothetical protein
VTWARSFTTETEFRAHWPVSVAALRRLHEGRLILPDCRYELADDALQQAIARPAPNEIERALPRFWDFDGRFFGDAPFNGWPDNFLWPVHCAAYLIDDLALAGDLLDVFCPLLGPFSTSHFGELVPDLIPQSFSVN